MSLLRMQLQFVQSDFKSEHLFRTRAVATNFVTSPKNAFGLLCCYAVIFSNQRQSSSVFNRFHSDSSSATSEHGTNPQRPSRNEEYSSRNEERNSYTPSSGPNVIQMERSKITCKKWNHNFSQHSYSICRTLLLVSKNWKSSNLFVYTIFYRVGAGVSTLKSISDELGSFIFHRTMKKTQPMWEEKDGKVFLHRQTWHSPFIVNIIKVLFPI